MPVIFKESDVYPHRILPDCDGVRYELLSEPRELVRREHGEEPIGYRAGAKMTYQASDFGALEWISSGPGFD